MAVLDGKDRCAREDHLEIYRHNDSRFRSQSPSKMVKLRQDLIFRPVVL
jgi:hypothetical protein